MTERQVCSKEAPYNKALPGRWEHPESSETDEDSDYYIEYRCRVCGLVFRVEMPD